MVWRAQSVRIGRFCVSNRELSRVDRRHDAVVQDKRDCRDGRLGQQQDRLDDARLAQFDAFVHRRHTKVLRARIERSLCALHRTVAIRVRFHDRHQATARTQAALHLARIVANGVQIYFYPRPPTLLLGNSVELRIVERKWFAMVFPFMTATHVAGILEIALVRKPGEPVDRLCHRTAFLSLLERKYTPSKRLATPKRGVRRNA